MHSLDNSGVRCSQELILMFNDLLIRQNNKQAFTGYLNTKRRIGISTAEASDFSLGILMGSGHLLRSGSTTACSLRDAAFHRGRSRLLLRRGLALLDCCIGLERCRLLLNGVRDNGRQAGLLDLVGLHRQVDGVTTRLVWQTSSERHCIRGCCCRSLGMGRDRGGLRRRGHSHVQVNTRDLMACHSRSRAWAHCSLHVNGRDMRWRGLSSGRGCWGDEDEGSNVDVYCCTRGLRGRSGVGGDGGEFRSVRPSKNSSL
jgi:hypothetical protein